MGGEEQDAETRGEPIVDWEIDADELAAHVRDDIRTDAAGWAERVHELSVWLTLAVMTYLFGIVHGWQAAAAEPVIMPGAFPPVDGWVWLVLIALTVIAIVSAPLEAYLEDSE